MSGTEKYIAMNQSHVNAVEQIDT